MKRSILSALIDFFTHPMLAKKERERLQGALIGTGTLRCPECGKKGLTQLPTYFPTRNHNYRNGQYFFQCKDPKCPFLKGYTYKEILDRQPATDFLNHLRTDNVFWCNYITKIPPSPWENTFPSPFDNLFGVRSGRIQIRESNETKGPNNEDHNGETPNGSE